MVEPPTGDQGRGGLQQHHQQQQQCETHPQMLPSSGGTKPSSVVLPPPIQVTSSQALNPDQQRDVPPPAYEDVVDLRDGEIPSSDVSKVKTKAAALALLLTLIKAMYRAFMYLIAFILFILPTYLPYLMIEIGTFYREDCPAQPNLPTFLIAVGYLTTIKYITFIILVLFKNEKVKLFGRIVQ